MNDIDLSTLPEGARIEQKQNGIIVRAANGKFLPGTTAKHTITQANASELNRRRYALARQAAATGMVAAVVEHGKLPIDGARPSGAWGAIINHATGILLDAKSPRAMSDLGRFIGQSAGMLAADRSYAAQDGDSVSVTVSAPADMVMAILAELARRKSESE